jgi:hypothetical protein
MPEVICVAGPYHGNKASEPDDGDGTIVMGGIHGDVLYKFHHRPNAAAFVIFTPIGASEQEIQAGLLDLSRNPRHL